MMEKETFSNRTKSIININEITKEEEKFRNLFYYVTILLT